MNDMNCAFKNKNEEGTSNMRKSKRNAKDDRGYST